MAKTVLVVDDDALLQREVARILRSRGYACECPKTSLEALRLALQNTYDLVITDLNMPVLDGIKLVARLRASTTNAKTPVLVLSALNQASTVVHARDLGVDGYVVKPVFAQELVSRAERLVASCGPGLGPAAVDVAASARAPEPEPSCAGPSAVIADTSEATTRQMAKALELGGVRVAAACRDGLTAVEAALEERASIVVLDLVLPRLSGLQAMAALRRRGLDPAFVVATMVATRDQVLAARKAGAWGYVLKPFDLGRLRDLVARLASVPAVRGQRR